MTQITGGLYTIQEPAAPAKRRTLHLKLICLHQPASPRPIGRPWPRQVAWRDLPVRADA